MFTSIFANGVQVDTEFPASTDYVVYCSNSDGNSTMAPFRVHVSFAEVVEALSEIARTYVVMCEPCAPTLYRRLDLCSDLLLKRVSGRVFVSGQIGRGCKQSRTATT